MTNSRLPALARIRASPRPRVVDRGGRPPPWARAVLRATEPAHSRPAEPAPDPTSVALSQLQNTTTVASRRADPW